MIRESIYVAKAQRKVLINSLTSCSWTRAQETSKVHPLDKLIIIAPSTGSIHLQQKLLSHLKVLYLDSSL